jgi:hypothetical protein
MAVATIQLHLGITEDDRTKIKEVEELALTPQLLQEYLDGFNEELDEGADDYLLQVVRMAYLTGFYNGLSSLDKISLNANYNEDFFCGD